DEEIKNLKNVINSKGEEINKLNAQIKSKDAEITDLKKPKPRGESGRRQDSAGSTKQENPKDQTQDTKKTQPTKKPAPPVAKH
ncbi:MAG: hypothetical protein Q3990_07185, partial [Desulfovibrionaceae bacterium]|nr:hypothetical protein [Desulfovibrionaceae bacterium]